MATQLDAASRDGILRVRASRELGAAVNRAKKARSRDHPQPSPLSSSGAAVGSNCAFLPPRSSRHVRILPPGLRRAAAGRSPVLLRCARTCCQTCSPPGAHPELTKTAWTGTRTPTTPTTPSGFVHPEFAGLAEESAAPVEGGGEPAAAAPAAATAAAAAPAAADDADDGGAGGSGSGGGADSDGEPPTTAHTTLAEPGDVLTARWPSQRTRRPSLQRPKQRTAG